MRVPDFSRCCPDHHERCQTPPAHLYAGVAGDIDSARCLASSRSAAEPLGRIQRG
jgi:hypothetical protein